MQRAGSDAEVLRDRYPAPEPLPWPAVSRRLVAAAEDVARAFREAAAALRGDRRRHPTGAWWSASTPTRRAPRSATTRTPPCASSTPGAGCTACPWTWPAPNGPPTHGETPRPPRALYRGGMSTAVGLEAARRAFLAGEWSEARVAEVVRPAVAASWARCRRGGLDPDTAVATFRGAAGPDPGKEVFDTFVASGARCSLVFLDVDGLVRSRVDADPELARLLDGLRLVPGLRVRRGRDGHHRGGGRARDRGARGAVRPRALRRGAHLPGRGGGAGRGHRGRGRGGRRGLPRVGGRGVAAPAGPDAGRAGRRAPRGRARPAGPHAAGPAARPRRRARLGAGHRRAHHAHQRRRPPARRRRPARAGRPPARGPGAGRARATGTSTCRRRAAPTSSWSRCCSAASRSARCSRPGPPPRRAWPRRRAGRARTWPRRRGATTPRTCAATTAPSTRRPASGPTASCSRRSCGPARRWRRASGRAATTC